MIINTLLPLAPLAIIPGVVWLFYFITEDRHPEPKKAILEIFTWGILIAPLAIISELFLIKIICPNEESNQLLSFSIQNLSILLISSALIPATVEETLKYLVVKNKAMPSSELDEPTDFLIYSITAGLGFATIENILFFLNSKTLSFGLITIAARFPGATLLHALATGTLGYFLALSSFYPHKNKRYVATGLFFAIIFHICYNFTIALTSPFWEDKPFFILPVVFFLFLMAIFLTIAFNKLKTKKGICNI